MTTKKETDAKKSKLAPVPKDFFKKLAETSSKREYGQPNQPALGEDDVFEIAVKGQEILTRKQTKHRNEY